MFRIVGIENCVTIRGIGILPLLLALGVVLVASLARAQSPQDERCRSALNSFITGEWSLEKLPSPDQCPGDIRLYVRYLASMKTDGSDENIQKQRQSLLAAAEAGNRSAQLLYTLLFTKITDSRFLTEITEGSFYSRYSSYIRTWHALMAVPDMAKYQAGPAVDGGVVEVFIPLHAAKYLEWYQGKSPGDKSTAASYLLTVAAFYSDPDTIKPYLRRLLSMDDTEWQDADRFAAFRIAETLARKEVYHCQFDKRCAADSNIKRLICDVRTPKGEMLLSLDRDVCDQLSEPLVRAYRTRIKDVIAGMIHSGFSCHGGSRKCL